MPRSRTGSTVDIVSKTLARNRLGVPAVAFIAMAGAAPMTVVAGGATAGWQVTGVTGIPIAYLAVALALAVFSVGYTAMSRKIVNSGAFYSYIAQGLGRVPGVGAAFTALYSYNLMQIGLYGGFGVVLGGLVKDRLGLDAAWYVYALAAWLVIAVFGVLRIDINGRVLAVLLVAEVGIAVLYAVVEVLHPAGGHVTFDTLAPARLFDSGIGAGLATAVAGFVGFEATAVYAEETKDPRRTVPRATYTALMVIGVLYGASSWAMSVATGPNNIVASAKEHSSELMFTLVAPHLSRVWLDLGHILFVTSLFAALLAFHNTVARYAFALGRERVLPAWLGTTGKHNSAPLWGSLTQSLLALVVLIGYAVSDVDPFVYLFFWLTVLGGLGVLLLMLFTSVAVVKFFAQGHRDARVGTWSSVIAPTLATLVLADMLYLTIDQFPALLGLDPASPWRWALPASFAGVALLGALWALIIKLRSPGTYATIGLGANSVTGMPPVEPVAAFGRGGYRG